MSKHQRTAGVDQRTVPIAGQDYTFRPLTVGVYASMEAYVVSRRPDPLAIASEAVKRLPASQHDAIWKAAMSAAITNRTISPAEMSDFENSVDGLCWKIWQSLKQDHPEIDSVEAARDLLVKAGEAGEFEKVSRTVEITSGEADLKKSSGQADEKGTEAPAGQ
jgi:hypothetical protein